ncbi:sodium:solute symporter family protein [Arenibacter sp. F20364]|uniref:sodium:solute symporter family protein n=1 Tax=Arenibacter sp. F20364 TaxID=2926415 RepID=UPI001FF6FC27|nr:sodium:solute symporter family protein [Arenibacter sp. F20364]MCK0191208.1 sodium:solute symporter family protein [Arenibacter sp. F20364]
MLDQKTIKTLRPTLYLMLALTLAGGYLYLFTDSPVFWPGFIAMIFFYGLIFYMGTYAATQRHSGGADDILLAGRKIPLWIGVFTMSATWVGGGYINGAAEYTYDSNFGLMWVQAPWGYGLSLIIGGLFFARKMRRFRFKTILDPLSQRYGKKMTVLLFFPALLGEIFWTAAILTALGATFATILGLDIRTAIVISSLIAIAYTAIGGMWAVALTDVVQLGLLIIGLIMVIPFALDQVGGWDMVWGKYQINMGDMAHFLPTKEALGDYYYNWWDFALLLIFGGIPWQVYFQRVLSSKNEKTAVQLSIIAGFVCILAAIPPVMIGVIGQSVQSWEAFGALGPPENSALILPYVVRYLTPGVVATIGLGAIAAAVMSSVDSSILSASSMTSWNVYRPIFRPKVSHQVLAKVIKRCIWIIGIAATILALNITSVYALWFLCSDFVYVLLFPQLVTALFFKKANFAGSLAGFIVAFVLRVGGGDATLGIPVLLDYPMTHGGDVLFPFRTLAMVSGLITIIVVSLVTQKWYPSTPLEKVT